MFLLVYVDDIIITGSNEDELQHLIKLLNQEFSLKDLGPLSYFLGVEVHKTSSGLHLSQTRYVTDLLIRSKMMDSKPLPTPMVGGQHISSTQGDPFEDTTLYRSLVGALQYVTIT